MADYDDEKNKPEDDIISEFNDGFKHIKARREESGWDATAKTCNDFFFNKQWPEGYRKLIEEENRPALTLNHVLGVVDVITSAILSNDADLIALPVDRAADPYIAQMLTKLIKQTEKSNLVSMERKQQVLDGLITGVGIKEKIYDYSTDLQGKLVITHSPSNQWYLDPVFKKPNYSDANELWKISWLREKDIKRIYGKKVWEQLKPGIEAKRTEYASNYTKSEYMTPSDYGTQGVITAASQFLDELVETGYDIKNKQYRVIERYERRWKEVELYFDPSANNGQGDYVDAATLSDEERVFAEDTIITVQRPYIQLTTGICDVLAQDKETDMSEFYQGFDFFFPYFVGGRFMGVVSNALDAQMEMNKADSTIIDILSRIAKAGGVYQKDAFGEDTPDVAKQLGKTGAWIGMDALYDANGRPNFIERRPGDVPPIFERLWARNREEIRDITGATAPLEGEVKRKQSGTAKNTEIRQSTLRLLNIIDNYRYTILQEGKSYVWAIQKYCTEERMVRIFGDTLNMTEEEITLNKRYMNQIANDVTIGEYDVIISFEGKSDSERQSTYFKLSEILQWAPDYRSVIVPRMFDLLPIPEKDAMKRELQQLQQQQMQMQQMQAQGERRGAIQSAPRPGSTTQNRIPQKATA